MSIRKHKLTGFLHGKHSNISADNISVTDNKQYTIDISKRTQFVEITKIFVPTLLINNNNNKIRNRQK